MTPAQFAALMLPYARQVQSERGIDAWAVITQWALETGNGTSSLFVNAHNVAGIKHTNTKTGELAFASYASLQAGVTDYINTLGLSYYTGVLATAGQPVPVVLAALGRSPWDAGHYGTPPGTSLINLWNSTYAAIAGQPAVTADPTSLFSGFWQVIIGLERASESAYVAPPWAGSQGLTGEHLGTVPTLADGANYLASMLQGVALAKPAGQALSGTGIVPAGATDPATVLGPVYVGLVNAATAIGTDILGAPWAAEQGLVGHHLGHPPDLDSGVSYLEGQASGLIRYLTGQLYVVPPPTTGVPPSPPPSGGGAVSGGGGVPLPPPPPSTGAGQVGLETAWQALQMILLQTVPAAVARVNAAMGSGGSSTPTIPHGQ